ncbi:MAG TPA: histidine kinase dimerization/phospho-acceptor domain-containing protein, partial [Candidatus Krumholzibacteria bacterium]|nr:histidine kinase dimerization/phospho-acceptor domain-containing protein [Candidatus Krumholzibacteria bacterium]
MKSIRISLLVWTLLGITLMMLLVITVLYRSATAILVRQLDDNLADRARTFAAVVKDTPEGWDFEIEDVAMPEFKSADGSGCLELWVEDTRAARGLAPDSLLYRSPNLNGRDFAFARPGPVDHPQFRWMVSTKNTRLRQVDLRTHAVVDPEDWDEVGEPAPDAPAIRVVADMESTDIDAFQKRLGRLLPILGAVCGALASVIVGLIVRRSLRPLDDLAAEIGTLDGADLSTRVHLEHTPREMAPVVEQLNKLLARLDEAFERERTFSADVAHELRTPLAGLRSTVEVAMSHPRDEAGHHQTYEELLGIIRRQQNMVETLLYLGRLESGHVNIERGEIDLSEFVAVTWESFEDAAREATLAVTREFPKGIIVVSDPALLAVAVRNLFDNAVTYANRGGRIRIAVAGEADRGVLRVANSGS